MERVRGRILKGDELVLEDLDIALNIVRPDRDLPGWSGSFYLQDPGACIEPGGAYRLVLEDGRSGEIIVSRLDLRSLKGTGIHFKGSGPLG